jgi:dolichyl-phosphate beta-glucosyltransferase
MTPYYSIIVPAYNEAARLGASLERMLAFVEEQGWSAEIVVVNDGSSDNTAAIVRTFELRHPNVRLLENPGNRGKGFSVRNGMLNARGQVMLFTDADLSSPIEEARKLFAVIDSGKADIAIGSRYLDRELLTRKQPIHRRAFGRAFNMALRAILGLKYEDTQCGFKALSRHAAIPIFQNVKIERWGFDPEMLFLADRYGFSVEEVPVEWGHDHRSKINPLRDGAAMLRELLNIRWNWLTGKYLTEPVRVPKARLVAPALKRG